MVVDPDIRIRGRNDGSSIDLERFVSDFQHSGRRRGLPAHHDRAGWIPGALPGVRIRARIPHRARESRRFQHHLGVSLYRRDALQRALQQHSLSVYAEDLENAIILLSQGERIYYDGRLVVSTEGPGSPARWFSQRVGWYHGLIKVYTERFGRIWRIGRRSRRSPPIIIIVYVGVLSLALHVVKLVSATLLVVSFASRPAPAAAGHWLTAGALDQSRRTSPPRSAVTWRSGCIALFTTIPRSERSYIAPMVPLYLFYAIAHIAPMTVGFGNWISLKLWRRRLYRDHYEPQPSGRRADREFTGIDAGGRMNVRGVRAPQIYRPDAYWEDRARRFAAEGDGLAAVCAYGMPEFYNRAIHLQPAPGAGTVAAGRSRNAGAGRRLRRRALEPAAGRARGASHWHRSERHHDRRGTAACGRRRRCRPMPLPGPGLWRSSTSVNGSTWCWA